MTKKERLLLERAEREADDPKTYQDRVEWTNPNGVFVSVLRKILVQKTRLKAVMSDLDRATGLRGGLEAASPFYNYSYQLCLYHRGETGIYHPLLVRVSPCIDLFTVSNEEGVAAGVIDALVSVFESHGFVSIGTSALEEAYDGQNPKYAGCTWWDRFFGNTESHLVLG